MVKRSRNTLKLKTPSLVLAKSLVHMRTLTQSLTLGRRSSPLAKTEPKKPKEDSPSQGIQQIIF